MSRQTVSAASPATADPHDYRGRPWTAPLFAPSEIIDLIGSSAARHRNLPAVTEVTSRGEPLRQVTYGGLWQEVVARSARIPETGRGVAGSVAIEVTNTIDTLVTVLAVMRAGAAAVLVDAGEPAERRAEMIATLGCLMITPRSGDLVVTPARGPAELAEEPRPPWRTALVVFTTGSTASAKPVAQSGYAIAVNARAVAAHHALGPGTTLACPLPISHVNGLEFGMFAALCSGAHALLMTTFDPLRFASALAVTGANLATTVPGIVAALAESRRVDLPGLRYLVSAAAPLHTATARAVHDRFGLRVVQGYGLSECMNFATTMPVDLSDEQYGTWMLDPTTPPVGRPLWGCEVAVDDGRGAGSAGVGVVGEICVRGHSVMSGYLGNAAATAETLRDGWLRTGDRGRWDEGPGGQRLITITGRVKNIAKCGGIGISLEELERAVRRWPGIADACCVARPHAALGEALTLFVVAARGVSTAETTSGAHERVATVVDPGRTALRIVVVQQLPKLRSGKPDRRTLAAQADGA